MFKKILFSLAVVLSVVLSFFVAPKVFAVEKISNYDVLMNIQPNGDIQVQEIIHYDFGTHNRHGIFRDIPIIYKSGNRKFNFEITDISVVDKNKRPYKFQTTRENGNIHIKIGDPDVLITGQHTYEINYTVKKPVTFYDTVDRISWNFIGTLWEVPIDHVNLVATLPKNFGGKVESASCYFGAFGSTESCPSFTHTQNRLTATLDNLGDGVGATLDIDLQKGVLVPPTATETLVSYLKVWWPVLIPILVFVFLFSRWWKTGRDPKGKGTIITQFDAPDNLTPAEVGTMLDEKADNKDVFAEIIYLASQGYLKIFKEEKKGWFGSEEYTLTLLKPTGPIENSVDKQLLQALFREYTTPKESNESESSEKIFGTVKLSSLKDKFYEDLQKIKDELYQELTRKGYFKTNPQKTKAKYVGIGVFGLFFGYIFIHFLHGKQGFSIWPFALSLTVAAALFIIFSHLMPARTQKGVGAKEHILGLKNYLEVAEKDRIDFHNAPEKNPATFEKFLPFAMALGVEKVWAGQFADLAVQPSWYGSSSGSAFSAIAFTSGMSNFSSSAQSTMASSPSSSGGGGFSGGGGGGGGGGSW